MISGYESTTHRLSHVSATLYLHAALLVPRCDLRNGRIRMVVWTLRHTAEFRDHSTYTYYVHVAKLTTLWNELLRLKVRFCYCFFSCTYIYFSCDLAWLWFINSQLQGRHTLTTSSVLSNENICLFRFLSWLLFFFFTSLFLFHFRLLKTNVK